MRRNCIDTTSFQPLRGVRARGQLAVVNRNEATPGSGASAAATVEARMDIKRVAGRVRAAPGRVTARSAGFTRHGSW